MNITQIAHCSISENGTVDGILGDQTGKELCTRNFYTNKNKPWLYVYRFDDGDSIADNMLDLVNNEHIGYTQPKRLTAYNQWKKTKSIKKIKTPCGCDCSSGVGLVCIASGYDVPKDITTHTMDSHLRSSGAKRYNFKNSFTFKRGDIILRSGHVVVVTSVTGEVKPVINPYKMTTKILKKCSKGEGVKWVQFQLISKGYALPKYGIDGDYGEETAHAVKKFQYANNLTPDSIVGKNTRNALKA